MNKLYVMLCVILLGSVLPACGQAAPGAAGPETRTTTPAAAPAGPAAEKWNNALAEARKEGKVAVYSIWTPAIRDALTQAFKQKYGIALEFSPFTRGNDLLAKVQAERRAGLYLADAFGVGNATLLVTMMPEGVLGTIQPLLMLPEVMAASAWEGSKMSFADKGGHAVSLIAVVQRNLVYNTGAIKEGEITTLKDLLKPQYKGKITLNDPVVTGTGNSLMAHLGHFLWSEPEAADFLKRLLKDQEAVIQRDQRLQVESVARGKYAIGMAPQQTNLAEFLSLGAPIQVAPIEEDTIVTAAAGSFSVSDKPAHPNATAVFTTWLLGQEGMTIFSKTFGNPSSRLDVPTEGIDRLFIRTPGKKYFMETDEVADARGKWLEIAKRIVDEGSK